MLNAIFRRVLLPLQKCLWLPSTCPSHSSETHSTLSAPFPYPVPTRQFSPDSLNCLFRTRHQCRRRPPRGARCHKRATIEATLRRVANNSHGETASRLLEPACASNQGEIPRHITPCFTASPRGPPLFSRGGQGRRKRRQPRIAGWSRL